MPSRSVVDPSTRLLSEVARHVVVPSGIVDTLWFDVEERCREFGDEFDAWQDGLGQVVLGLRDDGTFAATVGGITLSIPRQVAKTFIVMRIVVALCTLFPNLTVLWTAHRTRTASHTFQKMKSMVLRPSTRGYLKAGGNQGTAIRDANGEQEIPFDNGSRILFGAREQGFGRGFDEVDIEVFDEAQILTEKALEDMVAATNQSRWEFGALLFYMGTPPRPADPGEVFAARRADALAVKADGVDFGPPSVGEDSVYIECSADPDGDPEDREQWAKANPSYPHRTPLVSLRRLRKQLPGVDSWRREGLGVWDVADDEVGPLPNWPSLVSPTSTIVSNLQWSLAVSEDRQWASIGAAGRNSEGALHVERLHHRAGTWWIVDECLKLWKAKPIPIRIHKSGPEAALIAPLREKGIEVVEVSTSEVAQATGQVIDAVANGQLVHLGQPSLDKSVSGAVLKMSADGAVVFNQRKSSVEITPLRAVVVAAGGVPVEKAEFFVY